MDKAALLARGYMFVVYVIRLLEGSVRQYIVQTDDGVQDGLFPPDRTQQMHFSIHSNSAWVSRKPSLWLSTNAHMYIHTCIYGRNVMRQALLKNIHTHTYTYIHAYTAEMLCAKRS
jgi:hypothetical protein